MEKTLEDISKNPHEFKWCRSCNCFNFIANKECHCCGSTDFEFDLETHIAEETEFQAYSNNEQPENVFITVR
jgi:hypothetical protein